MWQHGTMILCAGDLGVYIDLGNDEPEMTLQRRVRGEKWRDYLVDGKPVKLPVDIESLPSGEYRLTTN